MSEEDQLKVGKRGQVKGSISTRKVGSIWEVKRFEVERRTSRCLCQWNKGVGRAGWVERGRIGVGCQVIIHDWLY